MHRPTNNSIQKSVIPAIVMNCLDGQPADYSLISHSGTQTLEETATMLGMPREKMLRSVIFSNGKKLVMAVLPLSHALDFKALAKRFGGKIRMATTTEIALHAKELLKNVIPPISSVVTLPVIIDNSILCMDKVCFEAGSHYDAVIMNTQDFIQMQESSVYFDDVAFPIKHVIENGDAVPDSISISSVRDRIASVHDFPTMPETCSQLLALRNKPDATVDELEEIIESDLSLANLTLRYARSSLFASHGKVFTLKDAIARVLGFDMVMNIAIGISIARVFRIPVDGPLGMHSHWHHCIAVAELSRRLAQKMPTTKRPAPGTVYLSGLLHNFGFLLLGRLFQPEFYLLNKLASANPGAPVVDMEKRVFGMGQAREAVVLGHTYIGSWLMNVWNMPEPITTIVRQHHTPDYSGKHATIVNLVQVANKLLSRVGVGDEGETSISKRLLKSLDLEIEDVESVFNEFIEINLPEIPIAVEVMTD